MKALILKRPGSIGSMQVLDVNNPQAQVGEVLVNLEAASLNPLDYKLVLAGHPAWKYPHIPGFDGAGTVCAVGEQVDAALIGQQVVFHSDPRLPGCFAQQIAIDSRLLVAIPSGLSCLDAATLPCTGLAALWALKYRAHVQPGQTVLIQSGAGGVGGYAIQIAHKLGARVITTCSPNNFEYVRSLGADEPIDYSTESFRDRVLELTDGKGAHVILDTMGSHSATLGLACLGYNGHLICLSGLPDLSKYNAASNAPSIHDTAIGAVHAYGRPDDICRQRDQLEELVEMLAKGELRSTRNKAIDMAGIPDALEELRDRHVKGKIIADLTLPIADPIE